MTGSGAVGSPFIALIRSGNAKNPITTNKRNEILLSACKSFIEVAPIIRKNTPRTTQPNTNANVSNISIPSGLKVLTPKASCIKASFIPSENNAPKRGAT